jgi:STE24 endopeptidase
MKSFGNNVPPEFEGYINRDFLKKVQDYEREKTKIDIISSLSGNIATIIFIFLGLLDYYNNWINSLNLSFIVSGLIFFLLLSYASTIISIPFSLYINFKIENKYGFNTMTFKLWIQDFMKSVLLSTILNGIVISIAFWIIQGNPEYWWLWLWLFFMTFSIFIMYIAPYVIEPLFNKFTPIENPVLENRIQEVMEKIKIKVTRVFKMDASKRSKHTNAYFSGIGKVKRIILYDTLLESMSDDEIIAVLAHEAGHWKKRHVLKMVIAAEVLSFIGLYISFRILQTDMLTQLFMIKQNTLFAKIILLGFIGGIISFPFTPFASYISRRFENQADEFALKLFNNKEAMISTLIKLSKDNLSNLYPHPLYVAFYYSHPPVIDRINKIKKYL